MPDESYFQNHFTSEVTHLIQAHVIQMRAPEPPKPMEVALPPRHWVDREELLDRLTRHLTSRDRTPLVVVGPSGVGKSALASKIAERLTEDFPDGQLYVDLENEDMYSALRSVLFRLGIAKDFMSDTFGGLQAQFRSLTRDRSMLVVVDGADDAAEGLHFEPASASSALAVFALRSTAADPRGYFALSDLDDDSATDLIAKLTQGSGTTFAFASWVALVNQFGTRPGTLRRLAGLISLRSGPDSGEQVISDLLAHPPSDLLEATYGSLTESASWLYRLLSVLPGPEFERSILEVFRAPSQDVDRAFAELADAQLVTPTREGRYLVEPSVTRDAARRIELEPLPLELQTAMEKSLRWYVKRAQLADRAVMGERLRRAPMPTDIDCPPFETDLDGLSWLQANHSALHTAIRMAVVHGWNGEAWALAEAMWAFYNNVPYPEEAERVYQIGVEATSRPADRARMLLFLGRVQLDLAEFAAAEAALTESRELAEAEGDMELVGSSAELIARSKQWQGRYDEAIGLYEASLRIAREHGHGRAAAIQLMYLGRAHRDNGDLERAAEFMEQALKEFTGIGDGRHVLLVKTDLAVLGARLGIPGAVEQADDAIDALREAGLARFEAAALERLGRIAEEPERRRRLEAALEVYERVGSVEARRIRRELG